MLAHKNELLAGAVHTKHQKCIILALNSDVERVRKLNAGSQPLCLKRTPPNLSVELLFLSLKALGVSAKHTNHFCSSSYTPTGDGKSSKADYC